MAARNFKFVSPGVFIEEIDNSQIPKLPARMGPLIIGRAEKGPGMRPVVCESFSEFVEIFGDPIPGGQGGDVWRTGNYTAPAYATYAAQAWLKNNSPITFVRLLGVEHENKTAGVGNAGWKQNNIVATKAGGAYGLFLWDRYTTSTADSADMTASLAAVFYTKNDTALVISGGNNTTDQFEDGTYLSGQGLLCGTGSDSDWVMIVKGANGDKGQEVVNFNFNRTSDKYIRKVFNTNPTLTNTTITSAGTRGYWLGETFDTFIDAFGGTVSYAAILGLASQDGNYDYSDWNFEMQAAETGYFFGQDLGTASDFIAERSQNLFKLVALDSGEWLQRNLKVSIMDIKPSTNDFDDYGTFTVAIRRLDDTDNAPSYIERFSNCSLNPNSPSYIGRKIGDTKTTWDETNKRYKYTGNYKNVSKYVRVELDNNVAEGVADPRLLPVGVYGPSRLNSGNDPYASTKTSFSGDDAFFFAKSEADIASGSSAALITGSSHQLGGGPTSTGETKFNFPRLPLRNLSSDGDIGNPQMAFWGVDTTRSGSNRLDESVKDIVRIGSANNANPGKAGSNYLQNSFVFTLDDIVAVNADSAGVIQKAQYVSGSRAGNYSLSAHSGGIGAVLETSKFNRFTTVFAGGFDGLDVREREPFRNTKLDGGAAITNYAFNTVKRAIDLCADAEVVEYNLATIPGVTNTGLTDRLIKTCEDRGDALAIIDLPNDYVPDTEGTSAESSRLPDVESTVTSLRNRGLNSSYGCAYFPWVQARDTLTNTLIWMPPSVAALGTMAFSERREELWFAPAGFTRGGLTEGAAGIPIVNTRMQLSSRDRDRLYDANINPIATFPAEGIVVFGQKTLQVTPSALDRINVRRLLIFLKKEVSRIAATTLFEQNVLSTWNDFSIRVEQLLNDVKSGLGLTDFKVVLDETTTTPELVDRNILYAKVFLKPARAIEFIALDFVITDTGASFED